MDNNSFICQYCNKTFPTREAYTFIQDDLGHKVYWCSRECEEGSKKGRIMGGKS